MAPRIVAVLLLSFAPLFAAGSWYYLPVNSVDPDTARQTDGLAFFFTDAGAASVQVTIWSGGKTYTQVVDTDRTHGERQVFEVLLAESERHNIPRMDLTVRGTTYTFERVRAGQKYKLLPLGRRTK